MIDDRDVPPHDADPVEALDVRHVPPLDRIDGPAGDVTDDGERLAAEMAAAEGWGDEAAE